MKVLVIGSGGREHTLGWSLSRSPRVSQIISCPGNGGLAQLGDCWDVPVTGTFEPLLEKVRRESVDLVVIGPEAPLVDGLGDRLRAEKIPAFGPNQAGSQLEGSKVFSKRFLQRHGIRTARFEVVTELGQLDQAFASFGDGPVVVKADGLAAGKGVIVASSRAEAEPAARNMLTGESFGHAGTTVLLEERLEGVELTMLVLVAGRQYKLLDSAQDYKRREDGNKGPNTGGMGSYSPTGLFPNPLRDVVAESIIEPTLAGLEEEGIEFKGVLYLGLMLTADGPQVLEYNVRFGDPEAQPVLRRLQTDLVEVFEALETGSLSGVQLAWDPRPAVCVVMASGGYPGKYATGCRIDGPVTSERDDEVQVFHAGTSWDGSHFKTTGGRVLGVTALGDTLEAARARAYDRVGEIHFDGACFRNDIADSIGSTTAR